MTSLKLMFYIVILLFSRSECQYYFSLSWLITWFSHDIADAECVNRLFDFFLASHPIMPVYYSSAVRIDYNCSILCITDTSCIIIIVVTTIILKVYRESVCLL